MNIYPLQDRVIIQRSEEVNTTASGIIIPDGQKEKPSTGKVIGVGPKVIELKAGDRVVFGKYAGTDLKSLGENYIIAKEEEIFGILVD